MGSISCNGLVSQMLAECSEPNGQRSLICIGKLEKPKATALHAHVDPANPSLLHDNHGGDDNMMLKIMTMQLIKTLQLRDMNKHSDDGDESEGDNNTSDSPLGQ
jgi:hypothetical protein